ncbi:hypothetical protein BU24DRAFT_439648 [Aaosphaeria arxii CBS 175.79]|uniref:Zn(2)-C6 fungal-type domain-containing protein n=1 Tax=Aaosphaeria arxii CBS 175.79 TaxID=1450172 RepID=A0A6A5Y234_9PLEO|nr:uncharacterized protein BU24DRAFT_439648 [Aaosphaeria arxii CBS 175.79]KAF2019572.1 hypothetical protein BU24DRAFT_439648 [Aaosphaeria arxii CBS 175.79]
MAGGADGVPIASRTRSRSGCLICRRRRRKCDGAQPRCRNCEARGDECLWGLKASFHPSRSLELSSEDSAILSAIESDRVGGVASKGVVIVNDTDVIVREYRDDARSLDAADAASPDTEIGNIDDRPDVYSVPAASTFPEASPVSATPPRPGWLEPDAEISNLQDYTPEFTENRRPADQGNGATGVAPFTTVTLPFSLGQGIASSAPPLADFELPIPEAEQSQLLSAYLRETGTWCETTDSNMHFTVSSIHMMMKSKPFVAAAMALASRQLDAVNKRPRQMTLALYQHAIQSLIHQDPSSADAAILATCTLLCVYEMMASDVVEWRRHLKGCAGLLKSRKWNGSSEGIVNACFWAFARIDIWAAFMIGEQTLMPTEDWVDNNSIISTATSGSVDAYCNLAILIFAKIINLRAKIHRRPSRSTEYVSEVNQLWNEVEDWQKHRPEQVHPLFPFRVNASKCPFETIIFSHSSSICADTFYHAGAILLLWTGDVKRESTESTANEGPSPFFASPHTVSETCDLHYDPVWHAKKLCGISISNTSHANWVNHLQPLYIAGQVFGGVRVDRQNIRSTAVEEDNHVEEEFPAEQIALLKHLARIERDTGWKTSGRAAELRKMWGLE